MLVVRDGGFYKPNTSFAEYKYDHFKKRTFFRDIEFPKELSADFAMALIPRRAQTSHGLTHSSSLELQLGGELDQSIDLINTDDRSHGSGSTYDPLMEFIGTGAFSAGRAPLTRSNTKASIALARGKSVANLDPIQSNDSLKKTKTLSLLSTGTSSEDLHLFKSPSKTLSRTPKSFKSSAISVTSDDDGEFDFDENDEVLSKKEIKNIDFFRVCALCELRLPRGSVGIKVLRKHVVKLK
jgi:hypothetical protein